MANLTETAAWESGVYLIETADSVLGGVGAPANVPHNHLANRTAYLKHWQDIILNLLDDAAGGLKVLPPSSEVAAGIARLATQAEVDTGTEDNLIVTPETLASALDNLASLLMPVGTVIEWPLSTPPAGFLELNGAAISRTVYATLFAEVGTTWGAGDGTTTFQLRDDRGEFKRGWDNGRGVDSGRGLNSWQDHLLASHNHTFSLAAMNEAISGAVAGSAPGSVSQQPTTFTGGAETRPRNIAVMYCVKY